MGLTAWNGAYQFDFVYDPTAGIPALVLEQRATDALQYIREPGGALVARIGPEGVKYYHFDALGSTVALTDVNGTVTDRYDYGAWGEYHPLLAGTSDNPYKYVGELGYYAHYQVPFPQNLDGMLSLGVRLYEPGVGRFGRRDPVRFGLNSYAYADGLPLLRVDPAGLRGEGLVRNVCRIASKVGLCLGGAYFSCWIVRAGWRAYEDALKTEGPKVARELSCACVELPDGTWVTVVVNRKTYGYYCGSGGPIYRLDVRRSAWVDSGIRCRPEF